MKNYKSINTWENKSRIDILSKFKNILSAYNIAKNRNNSNQVVNQKRTEINLIIAKVARFVFEAQISTTILYQEAPIRGGRSKNVQLFENLFSDYNIPIEYFFDAIDRAIGVYRDDKTNALLRTINPFFWLNKIFLYLAKIPFVIFLKLGFMQKTDENRFSVKRVLPVSMFS